MTKNLIEWAEKLQQQIRDITNDDLEKIASVPRGILDAWATLLRWNLSGGQVVRIGEEEENALLSHCLPADLNLQAARVKYEAMAYQLPDRKEWIVIARHAPAPSEIVVYGALRWAFNQPLISYVTELEDGTLASGFVNLLDQGTPSQINLIPGTSLGRGRRALNEAEISTEDYRFALALTKFYK